MTAEHDYLWDIFIAHAGADGPLAEQLYEQLTARARVFLDSRCLKLGDEWDSALAAAQKASVVTVVLVSGHTDGAYYQREEIAAAIAMVRRNKDAHRVVPIYVDAEAAEASVPYGLRVKHGMTLSGRGNAGGRRPRTGPACPGYRSSAYNRGRRRPCAGGRLGSRR